MLTRSRRHLAQVNKADGRRSDEQQKQQNQQKQQKQKQKQKQKKQKQQKQQKQQQQQQQQQQQKQTGGVKSRASAQELRANAMHNPQNFKTQGTARR
eukprot:scaffold47693_cov67-Phaeocystis_antarctica.AAC.5